jgi:preprotein translocase subunit SecE
MYLLPPSGFFNKNMKITEYIKETRAEMAHVTWPSRKQAISYSIVVVIVSIATAVTLGLFDYIFAQLLTLVV